MQKIITHRLRFLLCAAIFFASVGAVTVAGAQEIATQQVDSATSTATTTEERPSIIETLTTPKPDLTVPEAEPEKTGVQLLLEQRSVEDPNILSFMAYWVQKAIALGIPANTIVLILLIPILATIVTFVRVVVGLPSLEMLVPIALTYAFVAVGITLGMIILLAVICASVTSRILLKRVQIMYFPKRALSHLFLAFFVFAALTVAIQLDIQSIRELSIFPIIIITLLGDAIVTVQMRKTLMETLSVASVTVAVSLFGYGIATSIAVRDALILWPELILATILLNVLMGRYFGMRLTELVRFKTLTDTEQKNGRSVAQK
jgi:hypothetical protein